MSIKILSYVNEPGELDISDVHDFAEEATKPGAKVIFIEGKLCPQMDWNRGAVVIYTGDGTEQDVADAINGKYC